MASTRTSNPPHITDGSNPLWRAHNVFRVVTFLYACVWAVLQFRDFARPWLGLVAITVMGLWTVFTVWRYWYGSGRTNRLVAVDVLLVTALVLNNELVLTDEQMLGGQPSVTTIWGSTMVTAAALRWGTLGGVPCGALASGSDFAIRWYVDASMWLDAVLLVGTGAVVGMAFNTARESTERLAQALRVEAATAERERLARSIHDSVLQVLARVRQRGSSLDGEAAELAQLAGEQEIALRALIATTPNEPTKGDETDLAARLQVLRTGKVHVSVPGTPVLLPEPLSSDLFSVVREALNNVGQHAGADAQAWVLLEELPAEIVLCVRDDGDGVPEGRLRAAVAEGRMGVAQSIRGRVENLGGSINLETAPGEGTEWEVRMPRPRTDPSSGVQAKRASATADGSEGGSR